jgi:hypothetical protein
MGCGVYTHPISACGAIPPPSRLGELSRSPSYLARRTRQKRSRALGSSPLHFLHARRRPLHRPLPAKLLISGPDALITAAQTTTGHPQPKRGSVSEADNCLPLCELRPASSQSSIVHAPPCFFRQRTPNLFLARGAKSQFLSLEGGGGGGSRTPAGGNPTAGALVGEHATAKTPRERGKSPRI